MARKFGFVNLRLDPLRCKKKQFDNNRYFQSERSRVQFPALVIV